jgi:uncharacterized radical SAM superfamily protein
LDHNIIEKCLDAPFEELSQLFDKAYKISRDNFGNEIIYYVPGMVHFETEFYTATDPNRFPSISLTGTKCQLNCEHCQGKLLETMTPATTPEKLYQLCKEIKEKGGLGCLISGGSQIDGSVPIQDFLATIKKIKEELDMDIVVHTGFVHPEVAKGLGEAGIDGAMLDIIGSDETLREVYHLGQTVEELDKSLSLLEENNVPVIPHIVVGLHYGEIKGEKEAIKLLSKHRSEAVVVVAFMPLDQTPMMNVTPSTPEEISRVVLALRLTLPNTPILLGCARPKGEHKSTTDVLSIKAGVNGMAYPSQESYKYSVKKGLAIKYSEECCSLIYRDITQYEKVKL